MKYIKWIIPVLATLLCSIALSGSGTGGAESRTNTAIKVSFQKSTEKRLAAATLQELGINRLTLDIIPVDSASVAPPQVDLVAAQQISGNYSHSITGLTDNETYSFRIMAYDSTDNFLFGGQTSVLVLPGNNIVNITAYSFDGFDSVAGDWDFAFTDGAGTVTSLFLVDTTGNITGTALGSQVECWLAPDGTGSFILSGRLMLAAAAGAGDISGSLGQASGTGTATRPPSGTPATWIATKVPLQPI